MKTQTKIIPVGIGLVTLAIPCLFLVACTGTPTKEAKQQTDIKQADSVNVADSLKAVQPLTAWKYFQKEDKMTSKINYFADIEANEKVELSSPYEGGSTATLEIRYKDGTNNLILIVAPAQFNSDVVDGENIQIRFDQEKPIVYNCSEPSDGKTTMLFINQANSVIAKLKKAKKILIQAEFYQDGLKQIGFNTEGLAWNH